MADPVRSGLSTHDLLREAFLTTPSTIASAHPSHLLPQLRFISQHLFLPGVRIHIYVFGFHYLFPLLECKLRQSLLFTIESLTLRVFNTMDIY